MNELHHRSIVAVAVAMAGAAWLPGLTGCADESACAPVTAECAPLYEPTFDNVFTTTLKPRCGVAGLACHSRDGARAGLIFEEANESYDLLTGAGGGPVHLDPDALGCGTLLSRLGATEPARAMPPSAPLSEPELCAVVQWVAMGAKR
jgi:hypothetical protein